ncbi:phosphatidylglycerophosphatase A [Hwanghaeella grinnelliae]|uniref:Phosphatidylglycerophosphatase A n=1 Tax=Hwanghaeella grinnelliae TaxID=2500179 RepID=A0A3S2VQN6_9PROT|nr:phosphatidylglycerophosphatase A [Hwanghaeella grinnelliae]RVU39360.1 phosphatidylglycerophosphatase A [Hwanghaeella grinnelliae]
MRPSLTDPGILIATWFGSGYLTPAPGTWGTIAALPFAWFMIQAVPPTWLIPAAIILLAVGTWAANRFDILTQGHDASEIVVDEVVGVWLTLGIMALYAPLTWVAWIVAFVLFRAFDIVKPFPINLIDRHMGGGFGVMLDDVLAGVFAGVAGILAMMLLKKLAII